MPDIDDLIKRLSGIHTNDKNHGRAEVVAGHLVKSVLGQPWYQLSKTKQQYLIRISTAHLWDGYMAKRKLDVSPKEASEETILVEINRLQDELAPQN